MSLRRILPILFLLTFSIASAIPYIPSDGKQVVEHLPSRARPLQRELLRLRTELNSDPSDIRRACTLARRYIEQARIEGDPRYLGYAEAALAPWWKLPQPPDEVLVLRATLRQSTHQFALALADLDLAVRHDSANIQAWVTRATVQMVTGDFTGAKASCMRLYSRASTLVVQTCLSSIGSVNGHAQASYKQLKTALVQHPQADPGVQIWVTTLLAEMAARAGDAAASEAWFRQALSFDDADSYLLAAYADFLLDHQRAPEVLSLLKNKTRVDSLLLRYALAAKATGADDAAIRSNALRDRFDAAMLRGDTVHQREQARFEIALRADPAAAVRLAKLNWAVQKEPADFRILAETAAASGDKEAARLVLDWLAKTGLEDHTVAATIAQLKSKA